MTSPTRRPLDPSPEEIAAARKRLDDLLAREAAFDADGSLRIAERSAALNYTYGSLKWCLDHAAGETGASKTRDIREARAAIAAYEQWTAEQRAGDD